MVRGLSHLLGKFNSFNSTFCIRSPPQRAAPKRGRIWLVVVITCDTFEIYVVMYVVGRARIDVSSFHHFSRNELLPRSVCSRLDS